MWYFFKIFLLVFLFGVVNSIGWLPESFLVSSCALGCTVTFNPSQSYILKEIICDGTFYYNNGEYFFTDFPFGVTGVYQTEAIEPQKSHVLFNSTDNNTLAITQIGFHTNINSFQCSCIDENCYTFNCNNNDFEMDIATIIPFETAYTSPNVNTSLCVITSNPTQTPSLSPTDIPSSLPTHNTFVSSTTSFFQSSTSITKTVGPPLDSTQNDKTTGNNKNVIIIGGIVAVCVILLLIFIFKAKNNQNSDPREGNQENNIISNKRGKVAFTIGGQPLVINGNQLEHTEEFPIFHSTMQPVPLHLYEEMENTNKNSPYMAESPSYDIAQSPQNNTYETPSTDQCAQYDMGNNNTLNDTDSNNWAENNVLYDNANENGILNDSGQINSIEPSRSASPISAIDEHEGYMETNDLCDDDSENQTNSADFSYYDNANEN